jgi:hypothetical protein
MPAAPLREEEWDQQQQAGEEQPVGLAIDV